MKRFFVIVCLLFFIGEVRSQCTSTSDPLCDCGLGTFCTECCDSPSPVPIQGLPFLIGAGIAYGIVKLRKKPVVNKN